jgi:lantibiotic modifying enzyme
MTGSAGSALYWLIAAEARKDDRALELAHDLLIRSFENLGGLFHPSLYFGPLGIIYVHDLWIKIVGKRLVGQRTEKEIVRSVSGLELPERGMFDWIYGTGAWLSLWMNNPDRSNLAAISVNQVLNSLVPHANGIAVETHLNNNPRILYGWAHGIASPMVTLYIRGLLREDRKVLKTAEELAETLQSIVESEHYLPSKGDEEKINIRQSWCHGALGIGLAFLVMGVQAKNLEWEKTGRRLLVKARKSPSDPDGGLCHGPEGDALFLKMTGNKTVNTMKRFCLGDHSPLLVSPLGKGLVHNSGENLSWADFLFPGSLLKEYL